MKIEEILAEIERRKIQMDKARSERSQTRSKDLTIQGAWLALAELELWILERQEHENS